MKKDYCISLFVAIILLTVLGCKKPYLPPVIASSSNYLVVEGVINPGQDSTIVRLSRTVALSANSGSTPELNAKVAVESNTNSSYPLTELGNGYYATASLNLGSSNQYHLKITTADNRVYQSDFVPIKNSPPIDSVYYLVKSNGVQINADTHDPSNNTNYYRWNFNETWIIHSAFYSYVYFSSTPKDTVLSLNPANQIYTCWSGDVSTNIVLNSSAKLAKDIITNNPINFIPSTSEKIGDRYSILVKQYALTKDAYSYWQQLKNNTESLGTIFDPQPSEIKGNIHCITNPSEPVLGYISAGTYAQSRIFIDTRNLPAWLATSPVSGCSLDTAYFKGSGGLNEVQAYIYSGIKAPVYGIYPLGATQPIGYGESDPICVDCTLRGTNIEPSFWQ